MQKYLIILTLLDFIAMYILSPPVAFEQVQEKINTPIWFTHICFLLCSCFQTWLWKVCYRTQITRICICAYPNKRLHCISTFLPRFWLQRSCFSLPLFMELSQVGCTNKQKMEEPFQNVCTHILSKF